MTKRSFEYEQTSTKRQQRARIHTEAHTKTVAMMMEAAKQLDFKGQQESQESSQEGYGSDDQLSHSGSGWQQRPYW